MKLQIENWTVFCYNICDYKLLFCKCCDYKLHIDIAHTLQNFHRMCPAVPVLVAPLKRLAFSGGIW